MDNVRNMKARLMIHRKRIVKSARTLYKSEREYKCLVIKTIRAHVLTRLVVRSFYDILTRLVCVDVFSVIFLITFYVS